MNCLVIELCSTRCPQSVLDVLIQLFHSLYRFAMNHAYMLHACCLPTQDQYPDRVGKLVYEYAWLDYFCIFHGTLLVSTIPMYNLRRSMQWLIMEMV